MIALLYYNQRMSSQCSNRKLFSMIEKILFLLLFHCHLFKRICPEIRTTYKLIKGKHILMGCLCIPLTI